MICGLGCPCPGVGRAGLPAPAGRGVGRDAVGRGVGAVGLAAALGLLTSSGLPTGGLLTGCGLDAARGAGDAAGRGTGFEAVGPAGAAGGFCGVVGLAGGADDVAGAGVGLLITGFGVAAAGGLGAACGLAATWGFAATWGLAATGFATTGLLTAGVGWLGAAGAAFFTDRMAFPAVGLAGAVAVGLAPFPPLLSSERILPASASLIELLWLFAAIESFSAASSTSLFSRPRSLDSS